MLKKEFERKFILQMDGKIIDKEFIKFAFGNTRQYNQTFKEYALPVKQGYVSQDVAKSIMWDLGLDLKYNTEYFSEYRLRNINDEYYYYTMKTTGIIRDEFEVGLEYDLFSNYWNNVYKKLNKKRLQMNLEDCTLMFDKYSEKKLTIVELETEDLILLKEFETIGLEVTKNPLYHSYNMAK